MSVRYSFNAEYALHPDVSEERFVAFAKDQGGAVEARLDPANGDPLREVILRFEDPTHELRFVDDEYVEVSYAVTKSRQHSAHLQLISKLRGEFPMYDLLDLRELMRSGDEGSRILALRGYGAIFDGFWGGDPERLCRGPSRFTSQRPRGRSRRDGEDRLV